LNDLNKAYDNHDRHHAMPLTTLLNAIEPDPNAAFAQSEEAYSNAIRNRCPLYEAYAHDPDKTGAPTVLEDKYLSHPYATRRELIEHANEALEYLDHEYSAKGGLTAIVPSQKDDPEEYERAGTTILGQLILYNQRLVQRLHDLERLYADSMDVLAGEATAPHQILSRLGPDGRKPRDIVYPQDRFVLVNAGDDVWQYLHHEFSSKEIADIRADEMYRQLGTTGERLWEKRGGVEFAKGITAIDVVTRYYRLRNDPLKTIFVIPAYQSHPGTKVMREFMKQPTVVSVVKPLWPERVSTWEQKRRKELNELKQYKYQTFGWAEDQKRLEEQITLLKFDRDSWREKYYNLETDRDYPSVAKSDERRKQLTSVLNAATKKAQEQEAQLRQDQQEQLRINAETEELRESIEELKRRMEAQFQEREAALLVKEERAHRIDLDVGRAAKEMTEKLRKVWEKQIEETLAMNLFLKSKMPAEQTISQEFLEQARSEAVMVVNEATP